MRTTILGFTAVSALLVGGCVVGPEPSVPPPAPVVSQATTVVPPGQPNCRDWTATATINGQPQPLAGHACQQPDGTWQVVEGPPGQPGPVVVYAPPPYDPAYGDPWFYGPPIGLSVGAFFFIDRDRHLHDFARFRHDHARHFVHHEGGFHEHPQWQRHG